MKGTAHMAHELDGVGLLSALGTGILGIIALALGARVNHKLGGLEEHDKSTDARLENELRARRETISQLERDMVEAKARMETTLAADKARTEAMLESERAARKELEARLERAMEASEGRVLAAIAGHASRGEATAQVLFSQHEKVADALNALSKEFAQLKGRLQPLDGKEQK